MPDPEDYLAEWLEGIDLEQPIAELIEPAWLEEEIGLTLEELAYLEELGREYAQELREQEMIAETLPPLDMPEHLLEQEQDKDPDFGR
ncbi:MAG TPA: hypothetical protein VFV38_42945 [Ktedonobacteraceae bacterium]|nr:hypothetical protein [Ktedonobacteraceae bacterium]